MLRSTRMMLAARRRASISSCHSAPGGIFRSHHIRIILLISAPIPPAVDRDLHGRRVFDRTGLAGQRGVRADRAWVDRAGDPRARRPGRAAVDAGSFIAAGAPEPSGGWRHATRPGLLILDQAHRRRCRNARPAAQPGPLARRGGVRVCGSAHHWHELGSASTAYTGWSAGGGKVPRCAGRAGGSVHDHG